MFCIFLYSSSSHFPFFVKDSYAGFGSTETRGVCCGNVRFPCWWETQNLDEKLVFGVSQRGIFLFQTHVLWGGTAHPHWRGEDHLVIYKQMLCLLVSESYGGSISILRKTRRISHLPHLAPQPLWLASERSWQQQTRDWARWGIWEVTKGGLKLSWKDQSEMLRKGNRQVLLSLRFQPLLFSLPVNMVWILVSICLDPFSTYLPKDAKRIYCLYLVLVLVEPQEPSCAASWGGHARSQKQKPCTDQSRSRTDKKGQGVAGQRKSPLDHGWFCSWIRWISTNRAMCGSCFWVLGPSRILKLQ